VIGPRTVWLAAALCLVVTGPARAQDDPDTESARRHFERAARLYERADYPAALVELREAKALRPSPQFDYNIGRCLDRMERWGEAADAYQRFVDALPDAPEASELRERIVRLRARVPSVAPVRVPTYKRWWPWTLLGVGVGAGLAIGLGVGLSRHHFAATIPDLGPGVSQAIGVRF
jgi:tetratricopeptide (TPR) repeat protein